jgi:flagellar biosynthesis protein FlhG
MPDQAENLRRMVERSIPGPLPHKARRIAFLSGKGGVGKTSLAVNIALVLARMGRRTILMDCDIGLANADDLLGVQPGISLDSILITNGDPRTAIIALPSGLWLLPGAGTIMPEDAVSNGKLEHVLMRIDDDADFIIMDGGAGIDEGVQHVASLADEVVIVAAPERASTLNAYRLIKVLLEKNERLAIRLAINRAQNDFAARHVASRLAGAVSKFLTQEPEFIGWVPTDPIVEQSARERRPFVEKYPGSLPSRAIVSLAHRLVEPPPGPDLAA